ncbi:MAG TPA: hypothetical protein VME68_00560 [Acidobacteriaceae bacterium]|nr:hypothetical protein [Acidobacteriaceae bacterium]
MRNRFLPKAIVLSALAASLVTIAGCHVQVEKDKNGDDKNVKVDTPLGGLHVRANQTTAADLGLPDYPGAAIAPDNEGDKSADVHMGFGRFQMRIRVVTYLSSDDQKKVLAFYKNAMGRFGDVIECDGDHAVGSPSMTSEGLSCRDDSHIHVNTDGQYHGSDDDTGLTLRAGSKRHEHILAFKTASAGTKYTIVDLELPEGLAELGSNKSD